jgi:hypothetical protein
VSERVIRARHFALADAVDRLTPGSGSGAARRLVQIFDGGAMPTLPGHFYLSHPVEVGGAEVEGGSASPVVDNSRRFPWSSLAKYPPQATS